MFGARLYTFAAPWLAGVMVMDVLDFFDSLRFRSMLAQVLTDLTTNLVETFVVALVNQVFGVT
jgi:hypothetical protein